MTQIQMELTEDADIMVEVHKAKGKFGTKADAVNDLIMRAGRDLGLDK